MLGPEAVSDGLARPERGQRVLDRVRRGAAAAELRRLIHREGMRAGAHIHLGDTGKCPVRAEQDLGGSGVVSHGGASVFDDSAERHRTSWIRLKLILCSLDLTVKKLPGPPASAVRPGVAGQAREHELARARWLPAPAGRAGARFSAQEIASAMWRVYASNVTRTSRSGLRVWAEAA